MYNDLIDGYFRFKFVVIPSTPGVWDPFIQSIFLSFSKYLEMESKIGQL